MPSKTTEKSTKSQGCQHTASSLCSTCRRTENLLYGIGAQFTGTAAPRTAGIDPSSFNREKAFRPATDQNNQTLSSRFQQPNRSAHSPVQRSTRSVVSSDRPAHASTANRSSVAATPSDRPKARRPPMTTTTTTTTRNLPIRSSGYATTTTRKNGTVTNTNTNRTMMTQQQTAELNKALLVQRQAAAAAARHRASEEEEDDSDSSSSEEDQDDEDEDDDE